MLRHAVPPVAHRQGSDGLLHGFPRGGLCRLSPAGEALGQAQETIGENRWVGLLAGRLQQRIDDGRGGIDQAGEPPSNQSPGGRPATLQGHLDQGRGVFLCHWNQAVPDEERKVVVSGILAPRDESSREFAAETDGQSLEG